MAKHEQLDMFLDSIIEALNEPDANVPECAPAEGIDSTLAARGARYGDFDDHARVTQELKEVIASAPSFDKLTYSQREALDMILHKIGRIVCGDPSYQDSWTDIVGYARLVEKELE